MKKTGFLIPIVVIVVAALLSSIFIVDEREKALVLRFGQIKQVREEPGLGFKLPLLDEVVRFEDRILTLETPMIEVTPADDRRLEVDAFVLYRISDIRQFRQALGSDGERQAEIQLNGILDGQIRAVLGSQGVTSDTILSPERSALMDQIQERTDQRAQALGLTVVDVRLRQTNLPEQNFDATLQRMIAERDREATDERARGREAAQRVTALADRTYEEILSEARRDARITEGEADAERNKIFAQAYSKDPEFFEFYRSLSAYEMALQGQNSTMVMSPDSEFFNYLRSDQGSRSAEGERGDRPARAAPASAPAPAAAPEPTATPEPAATDAPSTAEPAADAPSQ
jgi:membrane protease subunit HflC